jgi:hypothetical protein
MHTTHTDLGPLDRFTERWRSYRPEKEAGPKEAEQLRKAQIGYSITCGMLYKYDFAVGETVRAGEDNCRLIAKLHEHGLLAIERGQIHASAAGLELLKNHPLKR